MENFNLLQKVKTSWIVTVLIVLLATYVGFSIYQNFRFRLVDTNPSSSEVATISPFFKLNFNKQLDAKSVSLTVTDGFMSGRYSISGKTITLPLASRLDTNTTYTVNLKSVSSVNGKTIVNRIFHIKPQLLQFSDLPEDQQQALLNRQDRSTNSAASDPIIGYLPHTTPDFTLSALISGDDANQSHLSLEATLYLSQADSGDPDAAIGMYKQEVIDYITSLKLDPNKYTINYSVSQP
jgi:hypothetical protein